MAWLLIDNSNSRTKLRLGDRDGLSEWRETISTSGISPENLAPILESVRFDSVVIASVVPQKLEIFRSFFAGASDLHVLTCKSPLGYGFDLEHPGQIGSDRLANVLALKSIYGVSSIAIDFGTAVTFSVLSAAGNFSGGVIAPGMDAMVSYLSAKTAQLPLISLEGPVHAIGKTTEEAMRAGAIIGQRGMIREILRELVAEMGDEPQIIATGGGADLASRGLEGIFEVYPDLTLEGLRILAERIFT